MKQIITCFLIAISLVACSSVSAPTAANVGALQTSAVKTVVAGFNQTSTASASTNASLPNNTPQATALPSVTALPSATLEPKAALQLEITQVLGTSNRNSQRLTDIKYSEFVAGDITVYWTINDNLTKDLIIFGAKKDAKDILKTIHFSGVDFTYATLIGTFAFQDAYGNAAENEALNLTFSKPTVDKINWDNFITDNIILIADPALGPFSQ